MELETKAESRIGKISKKKFWGLYERVQGENQAYAKEALKIRLKYDLELFAKLFFKEHCKKPFNLFHKEYFAGFDPYKKNIREAFASPRGSAKTTLIALILAIHKICYDRRFIVILSSKDNLANDKSKDILHECTENKALIDFYGIKPIPKNVSKTDFSVTTNVGTSYIMSQGFQSQIRGLKKGALRPTDFILDDVEHSERVYSDVQRDKAEDQLMKDVTNAGDEGTNIHFIGTILHRDSLLSNLLENNPAYYGRRYKSVLEWPENKELWDTWEKMFRNLSNPNRKKDSDEFFRKNRLAMIKGSKVFWPEKEDILSLQKQRLELGARGFASEKQNDPTSANNHLFQNLHYFNQVQGQDGFQKFKLENTGELFTFSKNMVRVVSIDPAHGQRKPTAGRDMDFASIIVGCFDPKAPERRLFVLEDITKRMPLSKQMGKALELARKYDAKTIIAEVNISPQTIPENFRLEVEKMKKKYKQEGNYSYWEVPQLIGQFNTDKKDIRIHSLEPKVDMGYIVFNRKGLSNDFMDQIQDYPHSKHDDAPDSLEMLWGVAVGKYTANGNLGHPSNESHASDRY